MVVYPLGSLEPHFQAGITNPRDLQWDWGNSCWGGRAQNTWNWEVASQLFTGWWFQTFFKMVNPPTRFKFPNFCVFGTGHISIGLPVPSVLCLIKACFGMLNMLCLLQISLTASIPNVVCQVQEFWCSKSNMLCQRYGLTETQKSTSHVGLAVQYGTLHQNPTVYQQCPFETSWNSNYTRVNWTQLCRKTPNHT